MVDLGRQNQILSDLPGYKEIIDGEADWISKYADYFEVFVSEPDVATGSIWRWANRQAKEIARALYVQDGKTIFDAFFLGKTCQFWALITQLHDIDPGEKEESRKTTGKVMREIGISLPAISRFLAHPGEEIDGIRRAFTSKVSKRCNAKMWTKEFPSGERVKTEQQIENVMANKPKYDIFIVDDGEFEIEACGEITIKRKKRSKTPSESEVFVTRDLQPLQYRILVHTLKKSGVAGDILAVATACWNDTEFIKRIADKKRKEGRIKASSTDRDLTGPVITGVSSVSSFLRKNLGVRLRTFKKGIYQLDPVPSYCVLFKSKQHT